MFHCGDSLHNFHPRNDSLRGVKFDSQGGSMRWIVFVEKDTRHESLWVYFF